MALKCKIVEKDEKLDSAVLTLGFPDENGQIVSLTGVSLPDMDAVEEGGLYVIGFAPYTPVASDPPEAVSAPVNTTTVAAPASAAPTEAPAEPVSDPAAKPSA